MAKSIDEYMALPYRMEILPDHEEGGFVVSFPELRGCFSFGESLIEAVNNAMNAKGEWFSAAIESKISIPLPESDDDYSGQFKLRIPKSLHRQLALAAKREGVSMNQYCVYLLSQANALHTHTSEIK